MDVQTHNHDFILLSLNRNRRKKAHNEQIVSEINKEIKLNKSKFYKFCITGIECNTKQLRYIVDYFLVLCLNFIVPIIVFFNAVRTNIGSIH